MDPQCYFYNSKVIQGSKNKEENSLIIVGGRLYNKVPIISELTGQRIPLNQSTQTICKKKLVDHDFFSCSNPIYT